VAAACKLLWRAEVHLLTFTGPAGVGKTRLALEVARKLLGQFEDGIYFVPLATIRTPDLVVSTTAQALGLKEASYRPALERLQAYLKEKQLLLLLDNFEQVIVAAPLVAELLSACTKLKVLVTSRAALHLQGEYEFPVLPLAVPDLGRLPETEALSKFGAVALFIHRAQALKHDFALTRENARAVAEICVRLDGLPLAIELAAARAKLLSPQALLGRLDRRLQLLTGGSSDLPARHQTLRNAIEWSYNLLDFGEQRLFRQLAVFVSGCTLEAVEAVCGGVLNPKPDGPKLVTRGSAFAVLNGAASLLDKSLIQQVELADGEPRLVMLETIRDYALECLETSGEVAETRQAHANYYLALAEKAETRITGVGQVAWLDRLENDYGNLRAALEWSLECGNVATALRFGGALWRFWLVRGYLNDGRRWLREALARSGDAPSSVRAKALNGAGMLALNQGEYARAAALCGESLVSFRRLEDKRGVASALNGLGQVALFWQTDYALARSLYQERLAIFRELGDEWGMAHSLERLGFVSWLDGRHGPARSLYEESLSIYGKLGISQGIANSLVGLGHVTLSEGDHRLAHSRYEEALAIYSELRDRPGIAWALFGLGQVALEVGDHSQAGTRYESSLKILCALGDKWFTTLCLVGLAGVAAAERQLERAAQLLGAAEALREAVGMPIPPSMRASYERYQAVARRGLDKKRWTAAWIEGRSITPEQVVAAPMRQPIPQSPVARLQPVATVASPPNYPAGLTGREVEVLRLAARGLTSAQIAEQLTISPLTVNVHLRSIYGKLGVSSRSAATRYAMEHNLG
jgi:predicted ATPase/DNA-binding CsgD family transcriptional regulator